MSKTDISFTTTDIHLLMRVLEAHRQTLEVGSAEREQAQRVLDRVCAAALHLQQSIGDKGKLR